MSEQWRIENTENLNIENINKVLEWLDAGAPEVDTPYLGRIDGFNMAEFHENAMTCVTNAGPSERCGTTCCIAGYTYALFDGDRTFSAAAQWLGMNRRQYSSLFFGKNSLEDTYDPAHCAYYPLRTITPAQAAATIRHMIATGEVDWRVQP